MFLEIWQERSKMGGREDIQVFNMEGGAEGGVEGGGGEGWRGGGMGGGGR